MAHCRHAAAPERAPADRRDAVPHRIQHRTREKGVRAGELSVPKSCGRLQRLRIGLALLLGCCAPTQALKCYSSLKQKVSQLDMGLTPTTTIDSCVTDVLIGNEFVESTIMQSSANDEFVKLNPACFVSCEGPTKAEAKCSFACTRYASCLVMQDMGNKLAAQESLDRNDFYFFEWCERTGLCKKKRYWETRCCIDSLCNVGIVPESSSSGGLPLLQVIVIALVSVTDISLSIYAGYLSRQRNLETAKGWNHVYAFIAFCLGPFYLIYYFAISLRPRFL